MNRDRHVHIHPTHLLCPWSHGRATDRYAPACLLRQGRYAPACLLRQRPKNPIRSTELIRYGGREGVRVRHTVGGCCQCTWFCSGGSGAATRVRQRVRREAHAPDRQACGRCGRCRAAGANGQGRTRSGVGATGPLARRRRQWPVEDRSPHGTPYGIGRGCAIRKPEDAPQPKRQAPQTSVLWECHREQRGGAKCQCQSQR